MHELLTYLFLIVIDNDDLRKWWRG